MVAAISPEFIWPDLAYEARAKVLASIPEYARIDVDYWKAKYPKGSDVRAVAAECGIMTLRELEITDMANDATTILENIKNKEWTSEEVTLAFGKRACIAHQMTSCLADIFLEEGLARARELDAYYTKTGKIVGPLHGLPFSIKEHYKMKGHVSTVSILARLDSPAEPAHSSLNQLLYDAGAVFYVRTNMPQSGMQLETNSFWGETTNPWNTALTPGGSSGGCTSLLAFGGSPMSLGGDIGGSLRCPASHTGLWTLKCNTQRVPRESQAVPVMPGNDGLIGSNGPLARSLRDVHLFMNVVLGTQPWLREQSLVPLPWRKPTLALANRRLRIGIIQHDGVVLPQPPTRRALNAMIQALRKDGRFELVDFAPLNHAQGIKLAHQLYYTDAGATFRAAMKKGAEPLLPLSEWVISLPQIHKHSILEYWELVACRDAFRAAYLEHFNSYNVDAILCPTTYGPAAPLGTSSTWSYTCIWNLLDYPGASFPTGFVANPAVDVKDAPREYMSEDDRYVSEIYDPALVSNAPLGLQLVGRRFHEENLMYILGEISTLLPLQA